jgi:FkbM family methyltransferase
VKVLFVMRHSGYVRNFESTLRMLCDRGHTVHLAFQIAGTHTLLDASDVAQELCTVYPRFSRGAIPTRDDAWGFAARDLRVSLDYLRYLAPEYHDSPKLVARAEREAPKAFVRRSQQRVFRSSAGRAALARSLRAKHRAIPTDPRIDAFLQAHAPDLLVLTPLIEPGAPQAEYVRSARALGIRTALCVASWDNLTNKGLIHGSVDLVTVWNEMMKREAVSLHGIPAERVAVTGAQPFDHWFEWQTSTTRQEFCAQVGLPPERPYILYLCSSRFIAPEEASFVRSWIEQIRQIASPSLRKVGVLIRPHPQNADQWARTNLTEYGPVAVWPPQGQAPADAQSRADYFDSIYHSAAVVAVNTTAEIESAIVGRNVYTVMAPEFRDTQEGTLHFEHLRSVNGGLLHVARDFPEHLEQLDEALRDPRASDERCRRFVEAFVRPFGLDAASTPKVVDALERLAAQPAPRAERLPVWARLVGPALARKGARLQHAAALLAEERAIRAVTKQRRAQAAIDADADPLVRPSRSASPTRQSRPIRNWKDLARAYRALDYRQRVYFGRVTLDDVPGELLQDVFEHAQPERLDFPDADIYLRVTSKAERMRLRACAKEPFTIDWIQQWVGAGDVFYDIGSNVGVYSLVAAKKPGGGARVFAFDPSYLNIASLGANIVLNKVEDLIAPLPVALSDSTGLAIFALRALEPGSARHTLGDEPSDEGPTLYRQPVMTFRLDDLVDRVGLPLPNHIKLDVDGGELAVLAGAARTLASPSLRSMLIEVSTSMSMEITEALSRYGLQLHAKVNVQNKAGEYLVWYGLFTRTAPDAAAVGAASVGVVTR